MISTVEELKELIAQNESDSLEFKLNFGKEKGKITNTECQPLNNVSKRTATRDLDELIQKSLIEQVGKTGKGTYYRLNGSERGQTGQRGQKGAKNPPKAPKCRQKHVRRTAIEETLH